MPIGGTTVLALKLSKTTIRIDDLGDGARSAILMASILLTLDNTAVLMEEPENHQHPGGLRAIMNFVLKVAKDKKLQLFISTHNIELLSILHKLCKTMGLEFKTFFLERDDEGRVDVRTLKRLDVDTLLKLGLDPRFLDVI
ncbi:MAG: AAA family ATPase [Candidatus Asgardarchaeia archaeon]